MKDSPAGYEQDAGNPAVYWGSKRRGEGYTIEPAWTAEEGHTVLVSAGDCIPAAVLGRFIEDLQGIQGFLTR